VGVLLSFFSPIISKGQPSSHIPAAPAYGVYISLSSYDIQEFIILIMISLKMGCCYQDRSPVVKLKSPLAG
jgi:hypothetical protein